MRKAGSNDKGMEGQRFAAAEVAKTRGRVPANRSMRKGAPYLHNVSS